ncbi:hypothetical protein BOTNAR_0825g00020 [Botryotinia narcissicola]|uniref:Uncharacterized protein n=1 Tax=Botryotinia narcissicola TaxID=278944 RepID=A0A4Z1HHC8_9HELO|nr:hypothetical protein BOTNAR_0825g00020 [Botryotinia narcissicola]
MENREYRIENGENMILINEEVRNLIPSHQNKEVCTSEEAHKNTHKYKKEQNNATRCVQYLGILVPTEATQPMNTNSAHSVSMTLPP